MLIYQIETHGDLKECTARGTRLRRMLCSVAASKMVMENGACAAREIRCRRSGSRRA